MLKMISRFGDEGVWRVMTLPAFIARYLGTSFCIGARWTRTSRLSKRERHYDEHVHRSDGHARHRDHGCLANVAWRPCLLRRREESWEEPAICQHNGGKQCEDGKDGKDGGQ